MRNVGYFYWLALHLSTLNNLHYFLRYSYTHFTLQTSDASLEENSYPITLLQSIYTSPAVPLSLSPIAVATVRYGERPR